jgi:hypothetical protein
MLFMTHATPAFAGDELASRQAPVATQVISPPAFKVFPAAASRQVVVIVARPPYPLPPVVYPPYRTPRTSFTPQQEKVIAGILAAIALVGYAATKR